jgi:hypothetical protein
MNQTKAALGLLASLAAFAVSSTARADGKDGSYFCTGVGPQHAR